MARPMDKFRRTAGFHGSVLLFLAALSSCSQISGKLLVMEGNFNCSQERYTEAISSYMEALSFPESNAYAQYGLGTVYLSLGETDAALQR
ncbi:tetratricopeptide repeat protein, partial [Treponema sp. OttesenSCG-928-L16]|nr:tetratricopeptide repeat protein [Treponema sp. OttesenSCG-928-L16]